MRIPRKKIIRLVHSVCAAESARLEQLDIAMVSAEEITRLNKRYLNHRGPTDVISFDLSDGPGEPVRGQLVICPDIAIAEAGVRNLPIQRELLLYVTHGLLHILGYDDAAAENQRRMDLRQEELLDKFLKRP